MGRESRSTTNYVVIFAEHPVIGRVYWAYFDKSEVNASDYYGLTLDPKRASRVPEGWRGGEYRMGGRRETDLDTWQALRFLGTLLDEFRLDSEYWIDFEDDEKMIEGLRGSLEQLRIRSGQTTHAFINWIWTAAWRDENAHI